VASALFGLAVLRGWVDAAWHGTGFWGVDGRHVLEAGARLADGQSIYADPAFLYSPLTALLAAPLSSLPTEPVLLAWVAVEAGIAAAMTLVGSGGLRSVTRAFAVVAVLTFVPVLHDLMLVNVTVAVVAAMSMAAWGPDRLAAGVPLGLALAAVPKPLLLLYLPWLARWRPRTLVGSLVVAAVLTATTAILLGPATYRDWFDALRAGTGFAGAFAGNYGLTATAPALALPAAAVMLVGLAMVTWRGGRTHALVWATASGLVAAPYIGLYAGIPMLIALRPAATEWPVATLALSAIAQPVLGLVPPLFGAVAAVAASTTGRPRARGARPRPAGHLVDGVAAAPAAPAPPLPISATDTLPPPGPAA
jgi:hypothetical protein